MPPALLVFSAKIGFGILCLLGMSLKLTASLYFSVYASNIQESAIVYEAHLTPKIKGEEGQLPLEGVTGYNSFQQVRFLHPRQMPHDSPVVYSNDIE